MRRGITGLRWTTEQGRPDPARPVGEETGGDKGVHIYFLFMFGGRLSLNLAFSGRERVSETSLRGQLPSRAL